MGYVFALAAALLFGANGSVMKVLLEAGLSPAQLTLFRVAGTAALAGVVLLATNRAAFRVTGRQFAFLALLGLVGVALLQFTYAVAVSLMHVGIALLIEYLAVLLVALVAFFAFKERVKARLWIAVGCVIAGLALVAQVWASELHPVGMLMAFCAAGCLATYFLVGEREVARASAMAVGFWSMSLATVFFLVFGGWWELDPSGFAHTVSLSGILEQVMVPLWAPLAWSVVLGTFAPILLSLLALRYLTATAAGIVGSAEVVFAFVVAWLWLGESLGPDQMAGAAIVLIGIVLAQTARVNKVLHPEPALARQAVPLA